MRDQREAAAARPAVGCAARGRTLRSSPWWGAAARRPAAAGWSCPSRWRRRPEAPRRRSPRDRSGRAPSSVGSGDPTGGPGSRGRRSSSCPGWGRRGGAGSYSREARALAARAGSMLPQGAGRRSRATGQLARRRWPASMRAVECVGHQAADRARSLTSSARARRRMTGRSSARARSARRLDRRGRSVRLDRCARRSRGSTRRAAGRSAPVMPPPDLAAAGLEETRAPSPAGRSPALRAVLVRSRPRRPATRAAPQLAVTLARVPDPRALPLLEELATDADPRVRRARGVRRRVARRGQGGLDAAGAVSSSTPTTRSRPGPATVWRAPACRSSGWSLEARHAAARTPGRRACFPTSTASPRGRPDRGPRSKRSRSKARPPRTAAAAARAARAPGSSRHARRSGRCSRACSPTPTAVVRALAAARARARSAPPRTSRRCAQRAATPTSAPRIAAIDAGAAIVRAGRAAPPAEWRATLLERLGDPRPAVRAVATLRRRRLAARSRARSGARAAAALAVSPASAVRAIAALAVGSRHARRRPRGRGGGRSRPTGARRGGAARRKRSTRSRCSIGSLRRLAAGA